MGRPGSHQHMVTELMNCVDVEGSIEKATDHRLPLEQAIRKAVFQAWASIRGRLTRNMSVP